MSGISLVTIRQNKIICLALFLYFCGNKNEMLKAQFLAEQVKSAFKWQDRE
jgi:hypothetical protein